MRQGQLLLVTPSGDEETLTPLDDGAFRVSDSDVSPERLWFDQIANEEALRATRNTSAYYRFFTP